MNRITARFIYCNILFEVERLEHNLNLYVVNNESFPVPICRHQRPEFCPPLWEAARKAVDRKLFKKELK